MANLRQEELLRDLADLVDGVLEFGYGEKMGFMIVLQDGPIGESGVNGMQITEVLEFIKEIYKELNAAFPCRENSLTITKIEEAIHWQDARTKDRENRGVEGQNKD